MGTCKCQYVKLNTDCDFNYRSGWAYAGGVIRNEVGLWIKGFVSNLGCCSILEAELWTVLNGLHNLVNLGHTFVVIECDNAEILELVLGDRASQGNCAHLVNAIKDSLSRHTGFKLGFIYREANFVANRLASHAKEVPIGLCELDQPPLEMVK